MATARITKRSVEAAIATDKKTYLWDDQLRGFGLQVTPNGAKSYVFQYRTGGREALSRGRTLLPEDLGERQDIHVPAAERLPVLRRLPGHGGEQLWGIDLIRFDEEGIEIPFPHVSMQFGEGAGLPQPGGVNKEDLREAVREVVREELASSGALRATASSVSK